MRIKEFAGLLAIGIIFTAVAVVLFIVLLMPVSHDAYVAQNGRPVTGYVIDCHSNMTVNEESVYYIEFYYFADGKKVTGYTNSAYYYEDLVEMGIISGWDIVKGQEIALRVLDGHAVHEDFIEPAYIAIIWPFVIIFGVIGGIMFFVGVTSLVRGNSIQNGESGTGIFEGSVVARNGKHRIQLRFVNAAGRSVQTVTDPIYYADQVERIRAQNTFPICYKGRDVLIMIDPNQLVSRMTYEYLD